MYHSVNIQICDGELYAWCDRFAHSANNLYNAALFRIRQIMCSRGKAEDKLSDNEKEILREVERMNEHLVKANKKPRKISKSGVISYAFLDDLMKRNGNPDYFCRDFSAHAAQHILKYATGDISSFFKAMKSYKRNPALFTGVPKLPHYKHKQGTCSFDISNQECVIRQNEKGHYVAKLPKTNCVVSLGKSVPGRLKEVHVTPINGRYQISFVFDDELPVAEPISEEPHRIVAIDFGVSNFMAVTNNCGLPCILYKGGALKSANQNYNRKISSIVSAQTKGSSAKFVPTKEYREVTVRRNNIVSDFMLQAGKHLMTWCVEHRIDTVVLGENRLWKQNVNTGHVNNQKFVQIPYERMKRIIEYLGERNGIRVLRQEESYTSKASFLDGDIIPVYGKTDAQADFSGKRVHRGLYRTKEGTVLNADINGSANILRKCVPDAFDELPLCYNEIMVVKHPAYDAMRNNRFRQKSNPGQTG